MTSVRARAVVFVAAALAIAAFAAAAEPVLRLVQDPKPAGLKVAADTFVWQGDVLTSFRFVIENASTNLLNVDLARSTFIPPDGEAHPLSALARPDFAVALMPGLEASDEIDLLEALPVGSKLQLRLMWTLGALVESAAWTWEAVDSTTQPAPQPEAPASTVRPAPVATPTTPQETPSAPASADFLVGIVTVAVAVALLGLLVWLLWI